MRTLPVSSGRIPFEFLPLVPLFHPLLSQMEDLPTADAASRQEHRPISLQTLADGHTHVIRRRGCIGEVLFGICWHLPLSVCFCLHLSFQSTDEGAVRAVLDTNDIRGENEERRQCENMNIDSQEAVLGLLSMGSAHNHIHFHQDKHQNWHQSCLRSGMGGLWVIPHDEYLADILEFAVMNHPPRSRRRSRGKL